MTGSTVYIGATSTPSDPAVVDTTMAVARYGRRVTDDGWGPAGQRHSSQ
ncbi:hypothetical protein M1247_15065 [Mycobacterium sp. 21AC1]|nr:hypothetical protein [Mycobacterium sp. 21AC1]MDV3126241.1 hypothetical protein [Mycobacterium sp. 21AC1]